MLFVTLSPHERARLQVFYKERLDREGATPQHRRAYAALAAHLTTLAPNTLVVPPLSQLVFDELDVLIAHASIRPGALNTTLVEMTQSDCHNNALAVSLFANDPAVVVITGYALSTGLWREHSWVEHIHSNALLETTSIRDAYFGLPVCSLVG
jgi:hypothetical protein